MNRRKFLAIFMSLALVLGMSVPGTMVGYAESTATEETPTTTVAATNYTDVGPFVKAPLVNRMLRAAIATPFAVDSVQNENLVTDKTVTKNDDGTYKIQLEAYTTGTITAGTAKPCDIVLVLDKSTSMNNSFSSSGYTYNKVYAPLETNKTYYVADGSSHYKEVRWCSSCNEWTSGCFIGPITGKHYAGDAYEPKESDTDISTEHVQFYEQGAYNSAQNRLEALQSAANDFIKTVADKETDDRIAVVWFGQNATVTSQLKDATTNKDNLLSAVNNPENLESATEHGKGMVKAQAILDNATGTDRNKVVVMITDGEPAPNGTDNWSSRVVKQTIDAAYELKSNGTTIYTVSVMPGTDASNPTTDMDKYMSYTSSNYPNAQYTGTVIDDKNKDGDSYYSGYTSKIIEQITPGNQADLSNGGYYLTAGDTSALEAIFEKIANQTGGASIDLGSTTEIRDIVTPQFNLPTNADDITLQAYDCLAYDESTGEVTWRDSATNLNPAPIAEIDPENRTVTVTGFDFTKNFVASNGRVEGNVAQEGDFHGRKLVITFNVSVRDGFLGGNDVYTNGEQSGIYANNEAVENFTRPTVDIPIKNVTVTALDKNVYLLGSLSESDLKTGSTATCGNVTINLDPAAENFGLESWQNAYVNITSTVPTDKNKLTEDTTYSLSATVSPKTEGEAIAKNGLATGNINVFKPTLTYKDSTVYYGDTAPANYTANEDGVVWKHGYTLATDVTMIGTAPDLTKSYALVDPTDINTVDDVDKINSKTDIPVNVTVEIGETDVTTHVTFAHTDCTAGENLLGGKFLLHPQTCQLTITKTGGVDGEPYVFDIYKDGNKYTEATIVGNGSVTISELPVGIYKIEEDTSWSWRFEPTISDPVTLPNTDKTETSGTITCTNKFTFEKWLNGFSQVVTNTFKTVN